MLATLFKTFNSTPDPDRVPEASEEKRGKVISISNLSMGDTTEGFSEILKAVPSSSKRLIIEMPCISVPKLAISLLSEKHIRNMDKEHTMDQLLLDYDRNSIKSIEDYIYKVDNTDCLFLNPRVQPDNSIMKSVEEMQTLIDLPIYIREHMAKNYDYIFFVTQGKLDTATTYFSIRNADANVLILDKPNDWSLNFLAYNRLNTTYEILKEKLFFFSLDRRFKEKGREGVYVAAKPLIQALNRVPLTDFTVSEFPEIVSGEKSNTVGVGYINPVDYLKLNTSKSQGSKKRINQGQINLLTKIADRTREILQEQHLDEFVASLMNAEARQKVQFYIADIIRSQPADELPGKLNDVIEWVQKEITELGILQPLLDDPTVVNIEINGPKQIVIEKAGQILQATDIEFEDVDHLYRLINRMLNAMGKQLTGNEPVIDTVYHGTRICAVADRDKLSGLSMGSPIVSIRKFPPRVLSNEEVVNSGNASEEMLDFLNFVVPSGASIVAVGGTNSGKTSTIIRFPLYLDPLKRVIAIEDSPETLLSSKEQYKKYANLISLLTKTVDDPAKSYPIQRLIRVCMRLNPWGFLIGETRDEEAANEMLKAANTGHVVWTTTHANGCEEGAVRILQLCGNTPAIAAQISQSLDLFIYIQRLNDGRRVISRIAELIRYEGVEKPIMNMIFTYDRKQKKHIQVGYLKTNRLRDKIYSQEQFTPEEIKRWCRFEDEMTQYTEVKPHVVG